jgi:lipopolysaccharide/colanic/teichoic acid biosynthesis glycosyltransferase
MLKRFFDVVFSFSAIVVFSPLFLITVILVKLDSRGPVFYGGKRVGKDGKLFKMYKFRTMRTDADKMSGGPSCADDDPRITKVGLLLRKYKVNELPQLVNVLKGDMSFVGPRPEVQLYTDMFTEEEKEILTVRPGITDWASIWNSDEGEILAEVSARGEDPEEHYKEKIRPQKIKLQLDYVKKRSLWVDTKILFETVKVLLK